MKAINYIVCVCVAFAAISAFMVVDVNADYTTHSPIRIDSNSEFDGNHGVSSGNGTAANPWIIENFNINGTGYGFCIYVGNTTDYFVIKNCYLHEASGNSGTYYWNSGLIFNNVVNGKVVDTVICDNVGHAGILLKNSDENTFEHNYIHSNVRGAYVYHSDENSVIYNNFSSNSISGIFLSYSDENTIANNIVYDNGLYGIWLLSSDENTMNDDIIKSNTNYGIYLHGLSNSNTARNNTFESNNYGVYAYSSASDNEVYHNNFDNTNQAKDCGSDNAWDDCYPSGGNYWSDYTGSDDYSGPGQDVSGSDGIGDTPYSFSYAQDDYPLMNQAETEGLGMRDDPEGLGMRDDPE